MMLMVLNTITMINWSQQVRERTICLDELKSASTCLDLSDYLTKTLHCDSKSTNKSMAMHTFNTLTHDPSFNDNEKEDL